MASDNRIHYMDNLRALAMLAGVLFHAALAYSPLMHNFWPTADAGQSVWIDVAVWFPHLFRMPLFFVVAGFFAALMVSKRGIGGMLSNRLARVLLPLVIFWPLVFGSIGWMTGQAASNVRNVSPLLAFVKQFTLQQGSPPQLLTLTHLWFLYYLMLFYVLVWVASALELKPLTPWFASLRPGVLLGVAPLLLVPALASVSAPSPAPESFLPQLWALVYFGLFFGFGYQLYQRQSLLDPLRPLAPFMLIFAMAAYAAFLWLLKIQDPLHPRPLLHLMQAVLEAYACLWMTLWCLHTGKIWLNGHNRALRYVTDASYWVYIVHLPLLFAIQYWLLDVEAGWPVKFGLSVLGTSVLAFASYHWLVRNTLVGRLLNGQRREMESTPAQLAPV